MGVHRTACRETVRLIKRLHQYDVMRANKAPFAFGLEPRVPFLDKEFLDVSMTLDPADKMVCPVCREPCMLNLSLTSQMPVLNNLPACILFDKSILLNFYTCTGMPLVSCMPELNMMALCLHG